MMVKRIVASLCFIALISLGISCTSNNKKNEISYIGLNISDAIKLAKTNQVQFRVIERDGKPLAVTMDYIPGRINASLKDEKVIGFFIEGQSKHLEH